MGVAHPREHLGHAEVDDDGAAAQALQVADEEDVARRGVDLPHAGQHQHQHQIQGHSACEGADASGFCAGRFGDCLGASAVGASGRAFLQSSVPWAACADTR